MLCDKEKCEFLAAANARVKELEQKHLIDRGEWRQEWERLRLQLCDERETKEQAEAQCAAMRLRFEQYARNKCKLIAQFSGKLGKPIIESGKCQGYAMSEHDDEPHYFCQECPACLHNDDEEPDKGTALLEENRRMREALERLVDESERRLWIEKEEGRDLPHLARAIDLAQQAMKGTDNEKD